MLNKFKNERTNKLYKYDLGVKYLSYSILCNFKICHNSANKQNIKRQHEKVKIEKKRVNKRWFYYASLSMLLKPTFRNEWKKYSWSKWKWFHESVYQYLTCETDW